MGLPKPVHADRQAFVHFQANLYSVPTEVAGKLLTLKVTPYQIDIYHEHICIASHKRSFEKHRVFEKPEHRQKILRQKQKARQNKDIEFFVALDPVAETFLKGLTQVGLKVSYHVRRIMEMVDLYGKTEVLSAIEQACQYSAYHFEYVEHIIQQRRRAVEGPASQSPVPTTPRRGQDIRLREIDMSQYQIRKDEKDE